LLGKLKALLNNFSYLGYANIALYLQMKKGSPADMIFHELNIDENNRNVFHTLCYRGSLDCLVALLNYDRMCLKRVLYDELQKAKSQFRMKTMDIKSGILNPTIQHDSDTIKRHQEFEIRLSQLLDHYV
jgi:hypothetical protein